jgi:hypothetical protein
MSGCWISIGRGTIAAGLGSLQLGDCWWCKLILVADGIGKRRVVVRFVGFNFGIGRAGAKAKYARNVNSRAVSTFKVFQDTTHPSILRPIIVNDNVQFLDIRLARNTLT